MGRASKSGRQPLSSLEIAFLRTFRDECLQVRVALKDGKSTTSFTTLKHWVKSRVIPAFNDKFYTVDVEDGDVSIILNQDVCAKVV